MNEEGREGRDRDRGQRKGKTPVVDTAPAEKALIGYVLLYPARFAQCCMIRGVHFGDEFRAEVWDLLSGEVEHRGNALTPALIVEGIVRRGLLEKSAAAEFLVDCQDEARNAPDPETAGATFRDQILDYSFRRMTKTVGKELIEKADEAVSLAEVKADVQGRMFELMSVETAGGGKSLEQALADELRRLEEQESGVAPGLMSGIPELDNIWNGMCPGELVVVGARPSVGKTALGTQICMNLILPPLGMLGANARPQPGGIWSLEMPKQDLVRRMAVQDCRIDLHRVSRNEFYGGEKDRYVNSLGLMLRSVQNGHLTIVDPKAIDGRMRPKSITDIVAEVRHWRNRMEIKWIMVDYLQLIAGIRKKGESRELEVARTSQMLKQVAQELDIPVIALAQLRRPDKDRLKKRPTMNDLRESGSIEQDADIVILIHNWDYVSDDKAAERAPRENAEIIVAKYRNGRTGRAEVDYLPPSLRFGPRTAKGAEAASEHPFDPPH